MRPDFLDYNLAIADAQNRIDELSRISNRTETEQHQLETLRHYAYQMAMERDYLALSTHRLDHCAMDPEDPGCRLEDV